MYNGIGLTTPRGSGTNGYIQTNKFFIKPRSSSSAAPYDADAPPAVGGVRKPNKDILEHDRKRRIELRLLSLREALADQGYTEDEVEEKVTETRKVLEEEAREKDKDKDGDRAAMPPPSKRFSDTQSHQIAERKQKQLEVFRAALGIKQGFESSDHEHQEESQQEKSHSSENEKCDDAKAEGREKGSGSQHFNKNGKQPLDKVRGGEDFKDLKQHGGENKHGNNSTNDSMEDGEIRSSVTNIKKGPKHQKGNNKDDSDSDSYSGKENARKSGEKSVKKQKRHVSDSESDRDARVKRKQLGNNLTKSRRYDSDDSKSDSQDERASRKGVVEKHNKTSKSHKTINSSHPNRRHGSEDSETDDDKKTRSKISEKHRKPSRRHDSEDSLSESEDEKNGKRKVIAGHSKPSSRSNKPIRGRDSENSQHADDEKQIRGKVLEIQREPSIRIKEHSTIIDKKIVVNDKRHEKSCRDQITSYESHDMRSRRFLKKEAERDEREKMYETNDRSSESDTDDEKKRRDKGLEKQRKPTSRSEFESRYAHEKSKQRRHDSNYESSPSDTDDRKKTRGKLLEEQREPSSRQRIESDTNNKKKEVFNRDKHETRTAVGDVHESRGVRSGLVKESSGIYADKKRLHGIDKNSDSDSGRKKTAVVKHNTYKKRVNSVSGSSSSSSDYSSDTNSGDSSHSDDSSDYGREKHAMKKKGGDSVKRMDISKAKQGVSSMIDKKNNKEVQTDHHRDGKIGRDHESSIDSSKIKQGLGFSSRTERKNGKDVKNDQHSDDYDKRLHSGYQRKTERNDSFEPRRDGDRDGRGSREDRKRKVEDAGISDLSFRESRRPITDVEPKTRETRELGSYGRSQDYRREEDYPNSNRYEDKHESRGPAKDEQRYDDTKRRRRDDSPQYVPRDRHARSHEDDSGRGRRR